MLEDFLPGEATWDGHMDRCNIRGAVKMSHENEDLFGFTIMVAARFLDNLAGGHQRPISFRFGLREDSSDFIKLDALGTMIIVGARTEARQLGRILQAAERTRRMSTMVDDGPMLFIPIVLFGESAGYIFYVESPQEPSTPSAWFVKAALEFLAKRLGPAYAAAKAVDLMDYLQRMEIDGADPLEILQWQPLFRRVLRAVPKELLAETHRQIATELKSRIFR